MAGHSKWSNIKRRKGAQDAKKGKIFMRHAKDIYTAAKEGGGDPSMNAALRLTVEKAKAVNMPNDNIERAIKKATGTLEGVTFEEITYEGYGPGGTAVIVDVLTDNRNRTAAEIRHAFTKNNGNLGANGCVAYLFNRRGYIVIIRTEDVDEDELTLTAIDAGADDIETNEEVFEIYTDPAVFNEVSEHIQAAGYTIEDSEISLIPQTSTELEEDNEEKMLALIDMLEEYEDVQDVHHNLLIQQ